MKESTASIVLYGSVLTAVLFSTQIKQTYKNLTDLISGNSTDEKSTIQVDRQNINLSNKEVPEVDGSVLARKQEQDCLILRDQYREFANQHSNIVKRIQSEFEERQILSLDLKEQKSELKSLGREVDKYNATLESFRQPVPDNQVDEYNDFVVYKNKLVRAYWALEEEIEETQSLMNQSANDFERLESQAISITQEIDSTQNLLEIKCLIRK